MIICDYIIFLYIKITDNKCFNKLIIFTPNYRNYKRKPKSSNKH